MSPVITMNCILALAERGYGEDKGLATILSTAASIDVVHVISLFAICYSIVFVNGTFPATCYGIAPAILSFRFLIFPKRVRASVTVSVKKKKKEIESSNGIQFQTSLEANGGTT